jgi:DNA-binding beta-propeller fold protein YncE
MRTAWICAVIAAGSIGAGCTASSEDVRPPADQLSFPTGLAAAPDESVVFVTNANSELRYDSGSIGVIDLAVVQGVIGPWQAQRTVPSGCSPDPDHSETLVCDEAPFFKRDAGVRVGNFSTDLSIQDFSAGGATKLRVFVPTRGDPSIAWADYDGDRLRCTAGADTYALCDDAHRLTSLNNNPDLTPLPGEPFSVFADAAHGFAMATHLGSGSVTLINAPVASEEVRIVDFINNVFAADINGLRGASSISGRTLPATPGSASPDPQALVYIGASTDNRIQSFTVASLGNSAAYLLPGPFFFLNTVGTGAGNSFDTRALHFSPSGDRLYVANRQPPSVQIWDTSIGPTGVPRNDLQGASDICREASTLAIVDAGAGERAYVTCFQDGQVYVVDPTGQSHVEDIISVGRGPYSAVVLTGKAAPGRVQLLVSNFLEDTIAVIDLSLDSPSRNRVVLRIGTSRAP